MADYCSVACHYTQAIRNPLCAGTPKPQVCSVPRKTLPALPCDSLCGTGVYHSTGSCMSNGRCLCWWGWTGSNGCYVNGGLYKNRIIADRCDKACHYTRFYKNDKCIIKKPTSLPPSTALLSTTAKPTQPATSVPCDPRCQGGQGTCQSNGRCFCWWGWTGPNAVYIMSGVNKNRILADYCTTACHYTHDYLNPACASIPTPKVCSVPANKTVPPLPCDPLCGTGTYHSAGQCLSNGRCLCWWGWTGPNGCYVNGGTYNNRIIADRCDRACHYTHDHRNDNCTNDNTSTAKPATQPVSTGIPLAATTSVPCDPRCQGGQGTCQSNGRCFCWWGWTGPNAVYIMSGVYKNRILADYCTTACHYTHDYLNPACASIPNPKVCSVPANKTVPPLPCDPLCGTGTYHSAGQCLSNGRCLCWWGWTGPNACYVNGGTYNNRIIADRCDRACHYTHDHRNDNCTNNNTSTAKPATQPVSTGIPLAATTSVPCDPRCQGGQGTCQSNGRCFCWWGWTGPNAVYIMSGVYKNRILADYCTTACHYTHDYLNPACASIPNPKVCSVPANKTVPPLPCDPLCGTGTYHSAGQCLSNGRCLCWWGWTGPNACYVDGGTYNNRIIADRCDRACHYTHDYRNYNCTNNNTSTAKPATQPVSTGNPGTGSRTTGKPTTGMSYQSSTNQQTTKMPTTTSPKTSSTTAKQTSTKLPTSLTTGQTTTVLPTTKQKTTTQGGTSTAVKRTTTQAIPTTTQRTTTQGTTTTAAKPTTQPLATTGKTTTVGSTTSTMAHTTKQKTTTQGVSSTTAKATTTQAMTTRAKTTTLSTTTGTMAQTTTQKTTTQAVTTTAKTTTTQATTEPPEPTEPTEPPEPTEPTEPGVLQVRGMLQNHQHQVQNDVDDSEVEDVSNEEENQEEEEPKKFSTIGLVVVLIVLLVCVTAFAGAVWWTYGNGNQCPSILRGYEPVAGTDTNTLTDEFSSTHVP
ncbi:hypothetical protein ACROYT_G043721 [Oculina patagonica]